MRTLADRRQRGDPGGQRTSAGPGGARRRDSRGVDAAAASEVRAVAGRGMSARVDGRELRLGSTRLMHELGVDLVPLAGRGRASCRPRAARCPGWPTSAGSPRLLGPAGLRRRAQGAAPRQAVAALRAQGVRTRAGHRRQPRQRRGGRRGARHRRSRAPKCCPKTRPASSSSSSAAAAAWRWWATASTTRRRWPRPTSASRCPPAPTWPCMPPASR